MRVTAAGGPPGRAETRRQERPSGQRSESCVAYGAVSGVVFRSVRRWLPDSSVLAGVLFGGAVWAVSYVGVMPSLGLYPWPREDRPSRVAVMIGAHLVYGGVAAAPDERLASPERLASARGPASATTTPATTTNTTA